MKISSAFSIPAIVSAVLMPGTAPTCCSPSPEGRPVLFGDQTNIVIWDEDNKIEHFVRKALFRSNAANFGFIAPTPTKPQLSEASQEAFQTLGGLNPARQSFGAGGLSGSSSGGVEVVLEKDVAGYRATTLRASDSGSLALWMLANGYRSTLGIQSWTKKYIDKGWFLTAFKVINRQQVASTGTIRMSFKTNRPFNPFYVPGENIGNEKGTLRLFFVSKEDYEAHIGISEAWKRPAWTAPIPDRVAEQLATELYLQPDAVPLGAHVDAYVDSFPRKVSDDIYFSKTAQGD